jgi:hypothetical protein
MANNSSFNERKRVKETQKNIMEILTTEKQNECHSEIYLSDKDLAKILGLSPSWCRRQRYLRDKGDPHVLTIEAVYVGSSPRYKHSDVKSWLDTL